ncbi:hypothetical protein EG68_06087 [Paragonimus skrjabini miyazakii]|uniref:Uncharacterized protein n=1 Tax=Paragonimus skrjabini miyazakii TaxID=59628 RepID=A0A8S9YDR4_9TREM|nr:hypothetical protein EG68_06087 [Paragonimus skrjabini miyazakii]
MSTAIPELSIRTIFPATPFFNFENVRRSVHASDVQEKRTYDQDVLAVFGEDHICAKIKNDTTTGDLHFVTPEEQFVQQLFIQGSHCEKRDQ